MDFFASQMHKMASLKKKFLQGGIPLDPLAERHVYSARPWDTFLPQESPPLYIGLEWL